MIHFDVIKKLNCYIRTHQRIAFLKRMHYGHAMMIVIPLPALAAGIVAALFYHAKAQGWIYGVTAPFIPLFIVALSAIRYGRHGATTAGMATAVGLLCLWPSTLALTHIAAHIIPVTLFFRSMMLVMVHTHSKRMVWLPLGYAVTLACVYGALLYLALGMTNGALPLVVGQQLPPDAIVVMENAQKDMPQATMNDEQLTEIMVAAGWCADMIMLVFAARLAHYMIGCFGKAQRPSVQFTPYAPSHAVFFLLVMVGWLGLETTGTLAHAARIAGMILFVPYACAGVAMVHDTIRRAYPYRSVWLLMGMYAVCIIIPIVGAAYITMITLVGLYGYARASMVRLLRSQ
jgi:hypothetical protein